VCRAVSGAVLRDCRQGTVSGHALLVCRGHTTTMLGSFAELLDLAHRWEPAGAAERSWRRRLEITAQWRDMG
jgi:hypothetical protein